MRTSLLWLWFGLVLALQGCMHTAVQPVSAQVKASELKQRYYQAKPSLLMARYWRLLFISHI